ncbi:putative AAA ATPase [Trypanosoma theileri]|uniref:Putative AAA ATPase n=1 Tax=Trypanosoma theileri TaxID=67003 RepID=A0A1X0NLZ2_9TRYP|nr:putative AAA ATPase [Trypanosoma theileri]ORC85726.1 putative AAA ATPase [Trypanosoma theileri]
MPGAPLFALTGRGNDVKRARDLINSIGGVFATRESDAEFLVVLKGAGRRKVEEFCEQAKKHMSTEAGGHSSVLSNGSHKVGRLLLLDMLEEWSRRGTVPQRHVSIEDVEKMNLLPNAAAAIAGTRNDQGRRSYDVPEGFLKRSRLVLDAEGNAVDESDNAVLLKNNRKPPPSTPLQKLISASPSVPLSNAVIINLDDSPDPPKFEKCKKYRTLLLDDESPPQKKTEGRLNLPTKSETVINPMRAAFRQRTKPDWDTYFSDGPTKTEDITKHNSNKEDYTSNMGKNGHVDSHDSCVATTSSPSLSLRSSTNGIRPPEKVRESAKTVVSDITKEKKNGVELTFNFTKPTPQTRSRPLLSESKKNNNSQNSTKPTTTTVTVNDTEKKKTELDEKRCTQQQQKKQKQQQHQQPQPQPQQHPSHQDRRTTINRPSSLDTRNSRQSKIPRDDIPCRKTGSGVLASDGTFGTPPPLPPRPNDAGMTRTTTTVVPTGRKTTTTSSGRFSKPSSSSVSSNSAANRNTTTNTNNTNSTDPMLKRIKQSSYCNGIPEETCVAVLQQIVDRACPVSFNSIAGLEVCKRILYEAIILPAKCPQLFTGLRRPCSGLLLFGPPGNGKTLLASAVAKECGTTFFSISAAAITSKWVGESEKMVRALFAVARALAPSTIFVDEIDALLQARGSQHEGEGSRRIKTEFLVQMDGAGNDNHEARVLVMGATNRPFDLDEAIIRRFPKRVFVPLPDAAAREQILKSLLNTEETPNNLTPVAWQRVIDLTNGYSGHDLRQLCEEAAMIPVRELLAEKLRNGEDLGENVLHHNLLRPLTLQDVEVCVQARHPSCCLKQLKALEEWSDTYGCK